MITREEATAKGVVADTPGLLETLKAGLAQLIVAARENRFSLPFDVTVRDADNALLRQFSLDVSGHPVVGACDDESGLFLAPFTLYLVDSRSCVARLRIGADLEIEAVEIYAAGSKN